MLASPIIERELRTALRRHRAVKSRFQAAAIAGGFVLFFLLMGLPGGTRLSGKGLHWILFYVGLYMAIVPAATISVGLFSEERRNQTLELLYLAGVGPGELFGGKLLGGAMVASCNLLALAPFLAVPFLTGGISFDLFLATMACFPAVLLFVTSVGVLASVLCRDDGSALICAVALGAIVCLATPIPYNMGTALAGMAPFSAKWLCVSPAYAPYLVVNYFGANKPDVFWLGWSVTIAWSLVFLGTAALLLRRMWRIELVRSMAAGSPGKFATWLHGDAERREALRFQGLQKNPFQWLAERDRRPLVAAWGILIGVVVFWLLGLSIWPGVWPSVPNFYLTAMVLIIEVELVIAYTAALRIGNDRRDGTLELLLTTPLTPEEIVDGQCTSIKRMFRPLRVTVFGICLLMLAGGLVVRPWDTAALITYFMIWAMLLYWCGRSLRRSTVLSMWIAINAARPAYALMRFRRQGLWTWFILLFNFRNAFRAFGRSGRPRFPTGAPDEIVTIGFVFVAAWVIIAAVEKTRSGMRHKLVSQMRSIAREPLPAPRDPRFKKWDVRERLPRATYEEMAERVRTYPQRMADAERERR